jgi:hypothetical protein
MRVLSTEKYGIYVVHADSYPTHYSTDKKKLTRTKKALQKSILPEKSVHVFLNAYLLNFSYMNIKYTLYTETAMFLILLLWGNGLLTLFQW